MLNDMAATVTSERLPNVSTSREPEDRAAEFCGIFRLNHNARIGLLEDSLRLARNAQNQRPGTRHEFQHLCGNHGLEDVPFLEKHEADVGRADERGNFFSWLLIEKDHIF